MANNQEVRSKTEELQEWLGREIKRIQHDISLLETASDRYNSYRDLYLSNKVVIDNPRYSYLTSEEMEAKVSEDRKKLEILKKQLELMCSASELDITDVVKTSDAGLSCWKANIVREIPDPYLELKDGYHPKCVIIYLGSRKLRILYTKSLHDYGDYDNYIFDGVVNIFCNITHGTVIQLSSGREVTLSSYGRGYTGM